MSSDTKVFLDSLTTDNQFIISCPTDPVFKIFKIFFCLIKVNYWSPGINTSKFAATYDHVILSYVLKFWTPGPPSAWNRTHFYNPTPAYTCHWRVDLKQKAKYFYLNRDCVFLFFKSCVKLTETDPDWHVLALLGLIYRLHIANVTVIMSYNFDIFDFFSQIAPIELHWTHF